MQNFVIQTVEDDPIITLSDEIISLRSSESSENIILTGVPELCLRDRDGTYHTCDNIRYYSYGYFNKRDNLLVPISRIKRVRNPNLARFRNLLLFSGYTSYKSFMLDYRAQERILQCIVRQSRHQDYYEFDHSHGIHEAFRYIETCRKCVHRGFFTERYRNIKYYRHGRKTLDSKNTCGGIARIAILSKSKKHDDLYYCKCCKEYYRVDDVCGILPILLSDMIDAVSPVQWEIFQNPSRKFNVRQRYSLLLY